MYSFEEILRAYEKQVSLPWAQDVPAAGRIWILWYEKSMQRKFSARLGEFENLTINAGHGWYFYDLASKFEKWLSEHEFFESLLEQPEEISGLLPDFEEFVIHDLKAKLDSTTSEDVFAIDGCASLFGLVRLSSLFSAIAPSIPGRMLVGFPGKHTGGIYRFLDARDGWNYHAVPIPAELTL